MIKKDTFCIAFLFIFNFNIFAMGGSEPPVSPAPQEEKIIINQTQISEQPAAQPEESTAQKVMKALAQAYPNQIDNVEFRDNDWAVLLRGTWYYYADGKLLTKELLANEGNFDSLDFYFYPKDLPVWRTPNTEEQERFRSESNARRQSAIRRSPLFYDNLWRARSHSESYDRVKSMIFLGRSVNVHFMIMENLSLVEETIYAAAKTDPLVQAWLNSISSIDGWQWRSIAETESRSYHAYGLAVDIVPRSYGGKETYWLWTLNHKPDWWNVAHNARYHPPDAVIKAFEKYGFIWGGKWFFYDTIHFEYRPEILILNGIFPETRR